VRTAIIGGALLVVGIVAAILRVEPFHSVAVLWDRVWPILLFVVGITVVTELVAEAGVFAVIAGRIARWGRGSAWVLWLLVCALCVVATVFFSLDTAAVLLTPVVIAAVRHADVRVLPFALTTVWLANTASLLLPVSNLTNLLAQEVGHQSVAQFIALSWAPAVVAIVVPLVVIAILYRRDLGVHFTAGVTEEPDDKVLLAVSLVVLALLLPALVSGVAVWIPACGGALVLLAIFAVRRRTIIRIGLVPWALLLFAAGLFLVVDTAQQLGLSNELGSATGKGQGFLQLLRLAGTGAISANVVNNLPAYLALEPTADGAPVHIMALLIGVNAGPVITPWASLATLLWHDRLKALEVHVPWGRYMILGLVVAPVAVIGSVAVLALVG
jgi:arsenical pump membrane protein